MRKQEEQLTRRHKEEGNKRSPVDYNHHREYTIQPRQNSTHRN